MHLRGALPERVRKRALEMADDADARVIPPRDAVPVAHGPQRTEAVSLDRGFKGQVYYVKVLPDGFKHKGQCPLVG